MSHIDEGLLHAHLDGALGPDEQDRWAAAELHLDVCRDCRRRLEEAREMRDTASALLSSAAPPSTAARPAFDDLVAQAEARTSGVPTVGPQRWWRTPVKLAWAASLVLAVGAGWIGRQLVVEEGGDVTLLTRQAVSDAEPAAGPQMRARTEAAAPARPEAEAEAEAGAAAGPEADVAAGPEADVRMLGFALKAGGPRCYAGPGAQDGADAGADVDAPAAGGAGVRALRLETDGTATVQLEAGPLVGFWEAAADSLHGRVTDGSRWFELRLAETESGVRGSLQPSAEPGGAERAAAANAATGRVELVDEACPGP